MALKTKSNIANIGEILGTKAKEFTFQSPELIAAPHTTIYNPVVAGNTVREVDNLASLADVGNRPATIFSSAQHGFTMYATVADTTQTGYFHFTADAEL